MEFTIGLVVFVVFAAAIYFYKRKPSGTGKVDRTPKSPTKNPRA